MNDDKVKRLLKYLGFTAIDSLSIEKQHLKHNSIKITISNIEKQVVFSIEAYRFNNHPTEWYISIPVEINENQELQTLGAISNELINQYTIIQSKYLKIFDKLHHNAVYEYPKLDVDIIIEESDNAVEANEFKLDEFEFRAKVIHPQIHQASISVSIEGIVKKRLLESNLLSYDPDFILTDDIFHKALLLSAMLTT